MSNLPLKHRVDSSKCKLYMGKLTIVARRPGSMRYLTVGDWMVTRRTIQVEVAETGKPDFDVALGLHELIEAYICRKTGISAAVVDEWDKAFTGDGEPGDDPMAPYHEAHMKANVVEGAVMAVLGIDEKEYEAAVGKTYEKVAKSLGL